MAATVISRVIRSSPHRDTATTWSVIAELLTTGGNKDAKVELLSVLGVAASIIAEHAPEKAPIVVTSDGPRTRIYCIYDDDAIEGSEAKEDSLGYDPLNGDWALSLPCPKEDLDWVKKALLEKSTRITARDLDADVKDEAKNSATKLIDNSIDIKSFFGQ